LREGGRNNEGARGPSESRADVGLRELFGSAGEKKAIDRLKKKKTVGRTPPSRQKCRTPKAPTQIPGGAEGGGSKGKLQKGSHRP